MDTNRFGDNSWGWESERADGTGRTCVEIYVDPACPWSWLTSRWLVEVAPHRNLIVRWRPYSVLLLNGSADPTEWQAARWGASLRAVRAVRVMQAVEVEEPARRPAL